MSGGWRDQAACVDVDPELFFPVAVSGLVLERQVAAAKAVCAGCPVLVECLADALTGTAFGIAGGLTAAERRGLGVSRPVLALGLPEEPVSAAEVAEAGRAALRAGRGVADVAAEFGVSTRTVYRWAAQVRQGERGAA
jgi:hypothetical protein